MPITVSTSGFAFSGRPRYSMGTASLKRPSSAVAIDCVGVNENVSCAVAPAMSRSWCGVKVNPGGTSRIRKAVSLLLLFTKVAVTESGTPTAILPNCITGLG